MKTKHNSLVRGSALQITSRVTLTSLSAAMLTVAAGPQIQQNPTGDPSWIPTSNLGTARAGHTATLLRSGKVLAAGGGLYGSSLHSAELYDPATGLWTTTGDLGTARGGHTATLLPSRKVLVAGGFDFNAGALDSAELYDATTGLWTATGSMTTSRADHPTATLLPNG